MISSTISLFSLSYVCCLNIRKKNLLIVCVQGLAERNWYKPLRKVTQNMESAVNDAEKMMWREEGQKYLFQSKRVLIAWTVSPIFC